MHDLLNPWPEGRASLLSRIRAAEQSRAVDDLTIELDAHNPKDPEQLGWIAGAMDALGMHRADDDKGAKARTLAAALGDLVRRPSSSSFRLVYDLSRNAQAICIVDDLLDAVRSDGMSRDALADIARRIASTAPDLNPVKLMIALLGETSDERDKDLVIQLGVYEELTVYSVVALRRMLQRPQPAIWDLAKRTWGWGRIQAIRRLSPPLDEEIRHWLLTEGFRNGVMVKESAYACAVAGRLLEALQNPQPSEEVLDTAARLLTALMGGGPAEGMDDYADGGEATRLFVEHVRARPSKNLKRYLQVRSVLDFVSEADVDWRARARSGWTAETRLAVRTGAAAFLARPIWRELAEAGLGHSARDQFLLAANVAAGMGVDTWPHHLRRQREMRSGEWPYLMRTDDAARIEVVIALAHEQLDLKTVGSGPTTSLGLGHGYEDDGAVNSILQDLGQFPGMDWSLVDVGLRGRSRRARNMALRALEDWDRSTWPSEAVPALKLALAREPDQEIAKRLRDLIGSGPDH